MKRARYLYMALFLALLAFVSIFIVILSTKSFSFSGLSQPVNVNESLRSSYETKLRAEINKIAHEAMNSGSTDGQKIVTYSVSSRGNPKSGIELFRALAGETFGDARGWKKAGVSFHEVISGGNFHLILSEGKYLPEFSSVCSIDYSCRVGKDVIINDDRWSSATASWNAAGGSLRDYRHMVINHEVGHFLGHVDNVPVCAGAGQKAPLMQQQSMNLRGCVFNPWPWPLDAELWVKL